MTRSFRKRPFGWWNGTVSEKDDKRLVHKWERREIRQMLRHEPERDVLPHRKDYGDGDTFAKDGKFYLPRWLHAEDPRDRKWLLRFLRK